VAKQKGFTLIELMIVVLILGILAAIALPNYYSMREKSRRASCIVNQRHIVEAATLYGIENNVVNANFNVTLLQVNDYINSPPGECPSSGTVDYDDYTITIANQRVSVMRCDIKPAEHFWDDF
jgi:prepilin-type N-terminal cleavage/methylation domain-containing protein